MSLLSRRRPLAGSPAADGDEPGPSDGAGAGTDAGPGDGTRTGAHAGPGEVGGVPRSARVLVVVVLAVLVVAGLAGAEAWPVTGWRLFSLARDDNQSRMVIEAVDGEGASRVVSPEELPLGYRLAEWPMTGLDDASSQQRQEVCDALLDAVVDVEPETVELRIVRDNQRLVQRSGEWTVTHDPEAPVASCVMASTGGGAGS